MKRPKAQSHLKQFGLSPDQASALQSHYDAIWRNRTAVSVAFYDALFEIAPETRALFKGNMTLQRKQLMAAIGFIITEIEKPDVILPAVKSLALNHVGYGVEPRHYEFVGIALERSLEQTFGNEFTPRLREAWRVAYEVLSGVMIVEAYPRLEATTADANRQIS